MKILGIETSCDETAAAVVENGNTILSNVVASQVEIHSRYGGIVPEVASRQHILSIVPIVQRAMEESGTDPTDINLIAVTNGPGLVGSLLVGVNFAKSLALAWEKPLIGINHLVAHIYANWLENTALHFPLISLIVSGGHTELVLMKDHGDFLRLGGTRDDAAGEAFDKVARVLGLGYPGGPAIETASKKGSPTHHLPHAWLKGSDDFSFSGLKTAVLHLSEKLGIDASSNIHPEIPNVAASFQESVVNVLVTKTITAAKREDAHQILLAGGVAANNALRNAFINRSPIDVLLPSPHLCTDNAAMISACAFYSLQKPSLKNWYMDVCASMRFAKIKQIP